MRSPATALVTIVGVVLATLITSPALAAPNILSVLELRSQFTQCGFEVGNPGAPPANQYVVIGDPGAASVRDANYRILMAVVYKDTEAALSAHSLAHKDAEARMNVRRPFDNDNGPQLLVGYGGSVWRANVAMVQSNSRTLASLYSYDDQTDQVAIARPELFDLGFVSPTGQYAVDRDFVACLDDAGVTAINPPAVPVPIFMRGQPW